MICTNEPLAARARHLVISVVAGFALLLAGCSSSEIPGVYRIDIQQGNVVTQDMLARLEPGMSKRQVRFVLGTPLLSDAFNSERWDYIYTFKSGTDRPAQRTISVFFEDEQLARLEGDISPNADIRNVVSQPRDKVVKVDTRRETGLFESLNPFDDRPENTLPETDENAQEQEGGASTQSEDDANTDDDGSASDSLDREDASESDESERATSEVTDADGTGDATQAGDSESDTPSFWDRIKRSVGAGDSGGDAQPATDADGAGDGASDVGSTDEQRDDELRAGSEDGLSSDEPASDSDPLQTESQSQEDGAPDTEGSDSDGTSPGFLERLQKTFAISNEPSDEAEADQGETGSAQPGNAQTDNAEADAEDSTVGAESEEQAEASDSNDADGGFFARIRERFKLPKGLLGGSDEDTPADEATTNEATPGATGDNSSLAPVTERDSPAVSQ